MYNPSVLILKADRLQADLLRQIVLSVFPDAKCFVANCPENAQGQIDRANVDLFLTGLEPSDGDVLGLLDTYCHSPRRARYTLAVTTRYEPRMISCLRRMPVNGVFDASTEGISDLGSALRCVLSGKAYWSTSIVGAIQRECMAPQSICRLLSPAEQRVLAVIGDGSDDNAAAQQLGLRPSSVSSVRREIHRKLSVRHRGELVRLAVLAGFVRFTTQGVDRPGFSLLVAACRNRTSRARGPVGTQQRDKNSLKLDS